MASKSDLRKQRTDLVINTKSKRQEKTLDKAILKVLTKLNESFVGVGLKHESQVYLKNIIADLSMSYPEVPFSRVADKSSMRPDGGILYLKAKNSEAFFPILIAEKKNQGTNDVRAEEGKAKQSQGNAIERLGKNVIGLRTAMLPHQIFPFVCFGDGCDFAAGSSILDRVVTIAMFGKLNVENLVPLGADGSFNRGSFYFREKEWGETEMFNRCYAIAERSIYFYFAKYGKSYFI